MASSGPQTRTCRKCKSRTSAICDLHPRTCLTCCGSKPGGLGREHFAPWTTQMLKDPERVAIWEKLYGPDWREKI